MQTKTRDRLADLLKKGAPLTFIKKDLGLSIGEIIQSINSHKNESKDQNITEKLSHKRKRASKLDGSALKYRKEKK